MAAIPEGTVSFAVPIVAVDVITECVAEAWRTLENMPDATSADIVADVVRRLTTEYPTP